MFIDHRLLLLTDGRFPSGGHAHSSGLEAAVASGAVRDLESLECFLQGWLSCGLEAEARLAGLAADPLRTPDCTALALLDEEAEAAQASPALRRTGRLLGKSLLKNAARIWPADPRLAEYCQAVIRHAAPGQHPVAFGAAVAACLLERKDLLRRPIGGPPARSKRHSSAPAPVECGNGNIASSATLGFIYCAITGAGWAAVRLLPVDPVEIALLLARLENVLGKVAEKALGSHALRGSFAPLHEIRAEEHSRWEVRLFAS